MVVEVVVANNNSKHKLKASKRKKKELSNFIIAMLTELYISEFKHPFAQDENNNKGSVNV